MPRRLPALRRRPTALRVGAAALAVVVLAPLSGCSGDDDEKPSAEPESTTSAAAPREPGVQTQATVGAVAGRLPPAGRQRVAKGVARLIDGWWQQGYVGGEFPRTNFSGAFAGFTARAASRARRDQNLLSNAGIGRRLTGVEAVTRRVVVDILSVKQRPVAATARVSLLMRLAGKGIDRRDRISGRVLLTYTKGAWRVFGYDVRREMIR